MKHYEYKAGAAFFGWIGLFIVLILAALTSCEDDFEPFYPEALIGEWQMYFEVPIYRDTLYSPYFLKFDDGFNGQEELTEYWIFPFTWEADETTFILTWEDGSEKRCTYEIDGDWMTIQYRTDRWDYRLVTYDR